MAISILVRLVPGAAASRRVAGELEVVATGERQIFRDADELVAILAARSEPRPDEGNLEPDSPSGGTVAPDAY